MPLSKSSGEDAIHSQGGINITGGDIAIKAGDDGINAAVSILIAGGTIDITESSEGIEAPRIVIADGKTSVVSSDDGVNVSGGTEESTGEGGGPGGQSVADSSLLLTISGGHLTVEAEGDGLDSNGSIVMTGGTVIVNGPTANKNGSLDYDGTFAMTGGFLVAAGSSGMVQATSEKSTQADVLITYSANQQSGALIHFEDSAGKDIITFAPSKNYQSVFVSSPDLKTDGAYTLSAGGSSTGSETNGLYDGGAYQGGTKVVDYEASSVITWLSESGVTEARSSMGGPGGGNFVQGGRGGGAGGGGGMPPEGGGERPQRAE